MDISRNELQRIAPVGESVPQLDLTERDVLEQIHQTLNNGSSQGWSCRYVTDQIYSLIVEHPELSQKMGLPQDWHGIKKNLVESFYSAQMPAKNITNDFEINVLEYGQRQPSQTTPYEASVTIAQNGKSLTVPGSTWPNPKNSSPSITPGSYPGIYGIKAHKAGTKPGIKFRNDDKIPTLTPNSKHQNESYSTEIHLHCGDTKANRGSAGCVTIEPDYCQSVWNFLEDGSKGVITIQRKP